MSQDLVRPPRRVRDADRTPSEEAYRRLARKPHPDVNPDPETQEQFKGGLRAYEVLSDPQKRAAYDRGGDPVRGGAGAGFRQGAGFSFTDIMDAFFGGGGPGGAAAVPAAVLLAVWRERLLDRATRWGGWRWWRSAWSSASRCCRLSRCAS